MVTLVKSKFPSQVWIRSRMCTHNACVCLFLTWMFIMLQLASYGLPHRRQPCQADVYLLKHARITQAHERASPIRSLHFTAICHRLEELFPSCAPELKDSWVNVMCRKGSRCDRWAPRVSLSLCLRLLSKATVKYWAIRAFCQSESGVMGWGGGLRKRRIEARLLNSEAQRHNCQKSCSCTHKWQL